jgi:hypothetical protein
LSRELLCHASGVVVVRRGARAREEKRARHERRTQNNTELE